MPSRPAIQMRFAVVLAYVLGLGAATQRTLNYEKDLQTIEWDGRLLWYGDRLVAYKYNLTAAPVIFTVDRDGRREEITFKIPDASRVWMQAVAGSSSGEIAVVGGAGTTDNRFTNFVARISAGGTQQTITHVRPYIPSAVTFAPDGKIWTVGLLKEEDM